MKRKLWILLVLAALMALCFCAAASAGNSLLEFELKAGECYAIYNYPDGKIIDVTSDSDDLKYDIIVAEEKDGKPALIPIFGRTEGLHYTTSGKYFGASDQKPGLMLIIRAQSGRGHVKVTFPKFPTIFKLDRFPLKFVTAAEGSVNAVAMRGKNLPGYIPMILGGTTGTQIKRMLSTQTNSYELYKFTAARIYKYVYNEGKRISSEGIEFDSNYAEGGNTYYCVSLQILPESRYNSTGEIRVTKGNAVYGLLDGTGTVFTERDPEITAIVEDMEDAFGYDALGMGGYYWDLSDSPPLPEITFLEATDGNIDRGTVFLYTYVSSILGNIGTGSHCVTVNNGSATPHWAQRGITVHISADAPQEGMAFTGWQGSDGVCFANPSASDTYFIMPNKDVTVTATYVRKLSVAFEPGGGSGEMARAEVREGDVYALPECAFEAPSGRVFKAWSVKNGDAEAEIKNPGDTITVTADVTATALWIKSSVTAPQIVMNALRLDGQMCLRYYVAVPEDFDGEDAVMRFSLCDGTFSYADAQVRDGYRVFDCPVRDYQMGEEITATLTYRKNGRRKIRSDIYSVNDYLFDLSAQGLPDDYAALMRALRNYGHYIQPYLSRINGVTYTEMPAAGDVNIDAAKSGSAANAYDIAAGTYINGGLLSDVVCKLDIDDGTDLVFEFRLAEGESGEVTAKVGSEGGFNVVTPDGNGVYRIAKEKVAANNFEVFYPFKVRVDGSIALDAYVSVMTCISEVLNSSTIEDEKLAYAAMYEYWAAANSY